MKYEPHEYQQYAKEYIETHPVAAGLLDMGLGKTSITLTVLNDLLFDSFEIHKVLVIAPLRVARNTWSSEIEKWEHLNGLIYSAAVGTEAEWLAALRKRADIYIINRENVQWLIMESKFPFDYDMVVIDELSSFKNHQTKRFKALMKVRPKVKRIVGLTGTPSSNGLMDLWAEFRLLDMGQRLGRFIGQYRTVYFQPDKRNGQVIFSYKPLPGAEQEIYDKISDITISMKSTDHLQMPELVSSRYTMYLSEEEEQRYAALKQDLVLQFPNGEITAANAASLSGKLSQMANGAVYMDSGETIPIHDRKLDALKDYSRMKFIIDHTDDEIKAAYQKMGGVSSPQYDGMSHSHNPQACEDRIIKGIEEIDVLKERYRQAMEYMEWFVPAWEELTEDERYVLEAFYSDTDSQTNTVYDICDHFQIECSSAYNKKNRAFGKLVTLLYGKS